MAENTEPITVLEYGRLEDLIESRLRQREREFTVDEVADTAEVPEWKAREVLAYFCQRYAYFNHAYEDTYRVTLRELHDRSGGEPA